MMMFKSTQHRLTAGLALFITILTPFIVLQNGLPDSFSISMGIMWAACLVVFVLADLLAGPTQDGLWAGYLYLPVMIAFLAANAGAALLLILAGALIASGLRRYGSIVSSQSAATIRDYAGPTALLRVVALSTGVLAAWSILALTQVTPDTLAMHAPVNALVQVFPAALGGAIVIYAVNVILGSSEIRSEDFWTSKQISRLWIELLLLLLIVPFVLVYVRLDVLVFVVLMGLIAAQAVRYHQVSKTERILRERVEALSLLNDIGQNISANLMLDDVLLSTYNWVNRLLKDVALFYVALHDDQRDMVNFPLVMINSQQTRWSSRYIEQDPLLQDIVESNGIQQIDLLHHNHNSHFRGMLPKNEPLFYLGVPLTTANQLIGIMGIVTRQEQALDDDALNILETVAAQSSMALRNAMLYDRSMHLADNLAHINQSVQQVMFNLDGDQAMMTACETAMEIAQAQRAAIFMISGADRKRTRLVAEIGLTPQHHNIMERTTHRSPGKDQRIRVIPDINHYKEPGIYHQLARVGQFQAMAEIPLKSGTTSVGTLVVYHNEPHYYHQAELELLETLAHQITAALDNAELLSALELYAMEQAQLVQLSRISTSSLELEQVITSVTEMLADMIQIYQVAIGLIAPDDKVHLYDLQDVDLLSMSYKAIPEIADFFDAEQPIARVFYRHSHVLSARLMMLMEENDVESLVLVPLVTNNRVLGFLWLGDRETHTFADNQWRLIEMASNQIAIQLHNVLLYRTSQGELNRHLQELALIEDIAQEITSSLNLERLIFNMLDAVIRAAQATRASAGLIISADELRVFSQDHKNSQSDRIQSLDGDLMSQVIRAGTVITAFQQHDDAVGSALLGVPLKHNDQMIGAMVVESNRQDAFNQELIDFIRSLAGHAVISIQNTRMFQERQQQIETLNHLRALSLRLSSNTDRSSIIRSVLKTALIMHQGYTGIVFIYENETNQLKPYVCLRREGTQFREATCYIPENLLQDVIHSGSIQVVKDTGTSTYFTALRDVGYGSVLAVPIKRRNQVYEVLCLTLPHGYGPEDEDIDTLELLAAQAAGHLENAILYEQVNANNNRMRAILDSTRDGIILLDQTGRLIEANISAEDILGIDLEAYRGRNFAQQLIADMASYEGSDYNKSLRESLTEMARILRLDPQRITKRQIEIVHNGKIRYIEEAGSPVLDSRNEIMGRLLTLRDVTEERLLEAYRNEITSMIIHDLRGPLGSIMSSLMLVMEVMNDVEDETITDLLPISLQTGQRLMVMIDSLLDISRMETRKLPLEVSPVCIGELIKEAGSSLTFSFQKTDITLEQRIAPDLPMVHVDGDKIRRVLINLIDNALRFTPEGGTVLVEATLTSNNKVMVRVADTGPGIPASETNTIFDKFRQLKDHGPLRGRKGIGLGLTFCRLAVEAHHERIWIDQKGPLSGACFAFTLPVHH